MIPKRHAAPCVLLLGLLAGPALAQGGPPPAAVHVTKIGPEELQEHRRVTGELRARFRSSVATIEPGLVLELPVEEGQRVEKGAVIAVLDSRRLEIDRRRLASRETVLAAVVEAWDGELEMKSNDLAALRVVEAQGSSNPKEMADAQSEVRIAKRGSKREDGARGAPRGEGFRRDASRRHDDPRAVRRRGRGARAEIGQWVAEGDAIVDAGLGRADEAWMHVPQRMAAALGHNGSASTARGPHRARRR